MVATIVHFSVGLFSAPICGLHMRSKGVFSLQASGSSKHGGYGRHFVCRCVEEYIKDTKLDHVPDILCGLSVDDKIHQSYHEVVMSDSDVDKLLSAVHWEPCHGPFFRGYPWHLYDDITDYLRYTLYDVIALDSCLRANIQAPKNLRELFAKVCLHFCHCCVCWVQLIVELIT
jgi:hypothetical protein